MITSNSRHQAIEEYLRQNCLQMLARRIVMSMMAIDSFRGFEIWNPGIGLLSAIFATKCVRDFIVFQDNKIHSLGEYWMHILSG